MSLPRPRRLILPLVMAAALAGMLMGCGGRDENPLPPPPDIPQADADDIAQQIAAMTASDNGGWFFTVEVMAETLGVPIPPGAGSRASRFQTMNTFSHTRAGVTHTFHIGYFDDNLLPRAFRDSTVEFIEGGIEASGTLNANGLSSGTYGAFADSGFYNVEFVRPTSGDTLQLDIFVEDSSFALVNSVFTSGSSRLWYQFNLLSTISNLQMLRSALPSPYPVSGALEWIIDAKVLNSANREDFAIEHLIEGEMTFNGTVNATLKLSAGFGLGSPEHVYRVNLKTGAITKL